MDFISRDYKSNESYFDLSIVFYVNLASEMTNELSWHIANKCYLF